MKFLLITVFILLTACTSHQKTSKPVSISLTTYIYKLPFEMTAAKLHAARMLDDGGQGPWSVIDDIAKANRISPLIVHNSDIPPNKTATFSDSEAQISVKALLTADLKAVRLESVVSVNGILRVSDRSSFFEKNSEDDYSAVIYAGSSQTLQDGSAYFIIFLASLNEG